jgi:hypothetical protein
MINVFYKAIWKKGWTVGQSQLFGMLTKHWASEKLPSSDKSLEQIVLQSSREDKNIAQRNYRLQINHWSK